MKQFKDLNIKIPEQQFIGDKIKISKILNRQIIIHSYRIVDSNYKGKRLDLQISIGDNKHIVFTGSTVLMVMIEQITKEDFPFTTTIVEENDRYEFT